MLGRTLSLLAVGVVLGFLLGRFLPWPGGPHDMPPAQGAPIPGVEGGHLHLESVQVGVILDLYEQITGRHLVRDTNLGGIPPFSINGDGLSRDDLLRLIRRTLLLNGVALVPVDDRTEKVMTTGTNKNPRAEGIRVYTNPDDLPDGGQIVSYYMPLNHINPQEAAGIFELQSPVHTYGAYTPAPSAQAILLTEDVDVVRQLIKLQKLVDVPKDGTPPKQRPFALPGFPWEEVLFFAAIMVVTTLVGNLLAYLWVRSRDANSKL